MEDYTFWKMISLTPLLIIFLSFVWRMSSYSTRKSRDDTFSYCISMIWASKHYAKLTKLTLLIAHLRLQYRVIMLVLYLQLICNFPEEVVTHILSIFLSLKSKYTSGSSSRWSHNRTHQAFHNLGHCVNSFDHEL